MELLFATSNKFKVVEANKVGRRHKVGFKQIFVDYPEVRDNSVSKVALDGVQFVYEKVKEPVIVEDSGLFVKALNGFPGSYSRYVFEKIGIQGILDLMRDMSNREAYFSSAVAYCDGINLKVFERTVLGELTATVKGSSGFGFDPIFIPKGHRKTFAEDPAYKALVSHRAKSFESLCVWLLKARG